MPDNTQPSQFPKSEPEQALKLIEKAVDLLLARNLREENELDNMLSQEQSVTVNGESEWRLENIDEVSASFIAVEIAQMAMEYMQSQSEHQSPGWSIISNQFSEILG